MRASPRSRGTTRSPREALITGLVNDARAVLEALDDVVLSGEAADAVGLLALVAGQDVEPGDTDGTWRIAQRVAPDRMISTVDPDSRHMHKSVSEYRDGYKAHVAVEPETGLITAAAITPANAGDGPAGVALLAGEEPGLQVLADSAYGSGEVRAALPRRGSIAKRSRRSLCGLPCRAGSTATTSSSTTTLAPSHAPTVSPRRSLPKVTPSSVLAVATVRYATDARPPKMVARSTSANTTPSSSKGAGHGATATSPPTTDDGDPWSNVPSRGVHAGIATSATAASTAIARASAHRSRAVNLRRLINLGLHHDGHTWAIAT